MNFTERDKELNKLQKKAVDTIDGPLLINTSRSCLDELIASQNPAIF